LSKVDLVKGRNTPKTAAKAIMLLDVKIQAQFNVSFYKLEISTGDNTTAQGIPQDAARRDLIFSVEYKAFSSIPPWQKSTSDSF
jgi:hypothetical protein